MNVRTCFVILLFFIPFCQLFAQSADNSLSFERTHTVFDQSWRFHDLWKKSGFENQTVLDIQFDPAGKAWILTSNSVFTYDGYQFNNLVEIPQSYVGKISCLWIGGDHSIWLGGRCGVFHVYGTSLLPAVDPLLQDNEIIHIHKTGDHSLIVQSKKGVILYQDGIWNRIVPSTEMLPSDIRDWYRDSQNRVFALTRQGIYQRDGTQWTNPLEAVHLPGANSACRDVVESSSVGLMIVTEGNFLIVRQNDRWASFTLTEPVVTPLVSSQDGEIFHTPIKNRSVSIERWAGERFENVSGTLPLRRSFTIETVREAPDGALWMGGYRCLLRWERFKNDWLELQDIPPPKAIDLQQKKIWFADDRAMIIYDIDPKRWIVDSTNNRRSYALFETSPSGELIAVDWETFIRQTSIHYIHNSVWDASDVLHVIGRDDRGEILHAFGDTRNWNVEPVPVLHNFSSIFLTANRRGGIWAAAGERSSNTYDDRYFIRNHKIFLIQEKNVESFPVVSLLENIPVSFYARDRKWNILSDSVINERQKIASPQSQSPSFEKKLLIRPFGDRGAIFFALGISFLPSLTFACFTKNAWIEWPALQPEAADLWSDPLQTVDMSIVCLEGERSLVLAIGSTDTMPGMIVRIQDGVWTEWIANIEKEIYAKRLRNGWFLIGCRDGYFLLDENRESNPFFCALPIRGTITHAVEEPDGAIWMYVSHALYGDRVLRYRPDGLPPDTRIAANQRELRDEEQLIAQFIAVEKFGALQHWKRFLFSWRLDEEPWSLWSDTSEIRFSYGDLSWGEHTIEARAMDQDLDVDPVPARFHFYVYAVPLQERRWFVPAVLTVFAVLSILSILLLRSRIQLFRHAVDLEKRVKERTEELRKTEKHILSVSEREQQRIGQELHDGVVQDLAGMSFLGDLLVDTLNETAPNTAEQADRLISMLKRTRDEVRILAKGLAPVTIERDGLVSALQALAKKIRQVYGIDCFVDCDTEFTLATQQDALNLYRIAQEAINNAAKHAQAKTIRVRIRKEEKKLRLAVIDDGIGIPLTTQDREGMGIAIMTFRAERIGAAFSIVAPEEGGTRVSCELILEE